MKNVAESDGDWPRRLSQVRALVTFCRNPTWRRHVKKFLSLDPPDGVDLGILDSFSAQIAKWRYETVSEVFRQLAVYLPLLKFVPERLFANSQEGQQIADAFSAIGDDSLHLYVASTSKEVFTPAEKDRHWAMVCECPEHVQLRQDGAKHVPCWWNSRRLKHAWGFCVSRIAFYRHRARNLTLADCGGDSATFQVTRSHLTKLASLMVMRFSYLKHPPWSFSNVDSIEGAATFMAQVRASPWLQHDPVTRELVDRLGPHIEARADGLPLHPDLRAELDRFNTAPLDESAGEGVHRGLSRELVRATGASTKQLKASVRRKGAFAHIKQFGRKYGAKGRAVIRYEWRNWKRILQCRVGKGFRSVRKKTSTVLARIYRQGVFFFRGRFQNDSF